MRKALTTHVAWVRSRPFILGLAGLFSLTALYLAGLDIPLLLSDREASAIGPFADMMPNVIAARLPSAVVAIICVVLAYELTRRWHGLRVALMTTALFATSGWMLHTGRSATGLIFFTLVPLALFYVGSCLVTAKHTGWPLVIMAVTYALLVHIPGAIWFEIVSLILLRSVWWRHVKAASPAFLYLAGGTLLVSLGILALRLVQTPSTISQWLGVQNGLPEPLVFLDQWMHSATFIIRGPEAYDLWLGHAPLLDTFSLVALILGIIMYIRHWRNLRVSILASFGLIGSLLVGLNGAPSISYLLPVLYLIIGTGLTRLIHEWYVIFPRNPVARGVGTGVVAIAVCIAVAYHMTAYFIAWPRTPQTNQAYRSRLLQ